MNRGSWRATVHGLQRVGHDLGTKEPQFFEKSNLKYTSGVGSVENGVSLALKY